MRGLAIALESVGIIAIIAGIVVEYIMQADLVFVAITGGSVIIAAGGLLWSKLIKRS
jgi:hypothetical protein